MKTIRIFISSPGDVEEERERAKQVVESLRRRYTGIFFLKPVLWRELPLQPDMSFQQGIDAVLSRDGVDIAVFILWSRLGSPTGPLVVKEDGTPYRSGTEREYDLMMRARAQSKETDGMARPDILIYTRRDESSFDESLRGQGTKEKEKLIIQKKLVESFIAEEFKDAETGTNTSAYHSFDRPVTFSQRLREHLTALLDERAGEEFKEVVWDIEKQGPPFLGLGAFQPQHADVFFGREDEVLEARHALVEHARHGCAFLLITGSSGSGKSSLARAGLLPAVAEQEIDDTVVEWRTLIATPAELGRDPVAGLLSRFAEPGLFPGLRSEGVAFEDVVGSFRKDPEAAMIHLKQTVAMVSKERLGGVRALLLLDQLEEVFAMKDREALLALVEALARSGIVWVVATVRGDFLGEVHRHPILARLLEGRQTLGLLSPNADALRRMIEGPARLAGLTFEERGGRRLSDQILADAARHVDLLPLVEFVLLELYERRSAGDRLDWTVYAEELKGVEGALHRRAEEVFEVLPPEAQSCLPQVLKRLVSVGEAASDLEAGAERLVRQRMRQDEFAVGSSARQLIDAFVKARLFTTGSGSLGEASDGFVTVAHEALLRVWPRASAWAEGNRDLLRTRARVASRMGEAETITESDPLLELAKLYLTSDPEAFDERQTAFITRSVTAAEERHRSRERTRRNVVTGLAVLTLAAVSATVWATVKQREVEEERRKTQAQLERAWLVEGPVWMERAKRAWEDDKDPIKAMVLAARSVGFYGFGRREEESPEFEKKFPALLGAPMTDPDNEEARKREAKAVADFVSELPRAKWLAWSGQAWMKNLEPTGYSVAFSPDGGSLAIGSGDGTVKLWDLATGDELRTLDGHSREVDRVVFNPDGRRLVAWMGDGTAKLWDRATGEVLKAFHERWTEFSFSPDGTRLASGSLDGTVKLRDGVTGEELRIFVGHSQSVVSVTFSTDGRWLATGSDDGTVKLWDLAAEEESMTFEGVYGSLAFSPDGEWLSTEADDGTVKLWDTATWQVAKAFEGPASQMRKVAFSPDGTRMATGSDNGTVKLWDLATGEVLMTFDGHSGQLWSMEFSPDGTRLATGSYDGTVKLWDLATEKVLMAYEGCFGSVAFSPDGKQLATESGDGAVKLLNLATGKESEIFERHSQTVESLAISPEGTRLVVRMNDGAVKLLNAATGEVQKTLDEHSRSVAVSPDGTQLAVGSAYHSVKLWDLATWSLVKSFEGVLGEMTSVAFSPDGMRLAAGSSIGTVTLLDVSTGRAMATFEGQLQAVKSIAFSPDGARMIVGSDDGLVELRDATTGVTLKSLDGRSTSSAFSPDGTRLAVASDDQTVKLWNMATWKVLGTFEGHTGEVRSVSFSPDGMRLASGSDDQTLKQWDLATGNELFSVNLGASVSGVAFSPDGRQIVTGAGEVVGLWDSAIGAAPETLGTNHLSSIALSHEAGLLANGLEVWDLKMRGVLATLELDGHWQWVESITLSPDGKWLAAMNGPNGTVKFWNLSTGGDLKTLKMEGYPRCAAFRSDGKFLATGSDDGAVMLWDLADGKEIKTFEGHAGFVSELTFCPDGTQLTAKSYDGAETVWNVATRDVLKSMKGNPGARMVFSPHGIRLISAEEGGMRIEATGEKLKVPEVDDAEWRIIMAMSSAVQSPDGKRLAFVQEDGIVRLMDGTTEEVIKTFEAHGQLDMERGEQRVVFNPDGTLLASVSDGGKVSLRDAATGEVLKTFKGHSDWVGSMVMKFSPDGSKLATSVGDSIKLWNVTGTGPALPDFRAMSTDGLLRFGEEEVAIGATIPNLFRPSDFSLRLQHDDELSVLANPNLPPAENASLRLRLLARSKQWRAAKAWWSSGAGESFPALRQDYLVLLLISSGDQVATAAPGSFAELSREIAATLEVDSLADMRVSLALGEHLLQASDPGKCPDKEWQDLLGRSLETTTPTWRKAIASRAETRKKSETHSQSAILRLDELISRFQL